MGSGHDPGRFELGFPVNQPLLNVATFVPQLNHKDFARIWCACHWWAI